MGVPSSLLLRYPIDIIILTLHLHELSAKVYYIMLLAIEEVFLLRKVPRKIKKVRVSLGDRS